MRVYVVTNPENGWDCVIGVYKASSEEHLRDELNDYYEGNPPESLIIHEKTVENLE